MKLRLAGLAAGAVLLATAGTASAAPVTVNLRIEGPQHTLFEDPVTVDVRPFHFTGDPTQHQCDGTGFNGGPAAAPAPTRGGVLAQAVDQGLEVTGTWSDGFQNPTLAEIAGEDVKFDPETGAFLGEYQNGRFAAHGSCGDPVQNGDDILFAYATEREALLKLTGPATAKAGETVMARVTDAGTGGPVAGAKVGESTSAADGTVAIGPFSDRGPHDLKATKEHEAVRSNRLRVCVTDGADGACGTTAPSPGTPAAPARDTTAPAAAIAGIRDHQRFRRGPRTLRGTVPADPSGVAQVKLGLTWSRAGHCRIYSPTKERFRPARCGRRTYFRIADTSDFGYLLPERLRPGRYVFDVVAIDKAGNRSPLQRGRTRVVFFVR